MITFSSLIKLHLLEAVVEEGELLVPPHHGRRERVIRESTLRLAVHEHELSHVGFTVLVGHTACRVVALLIIIIIISLVRVLPLFIIITFTVVFKGYELIIQSRKLDSVLTLLHKLVFFFFFKLAVSILTPRHRLLTRRR